MNLQLAIGIAFAVAATLSAFAILLALLNMGARADKEAPPPPPVSPEDAQQEAAHWWLKGVLGNPGYYRLRHLIREGVDARPGWRWSDTAQFVTLGVWLNGNWHPIDAWNAESAELASAPEQTNREGGAQ